MVVKRALNWVLAVSGALLGVLGLAFFGFQNPSNATLDRWWFSYIAASALFATVPLLGSTLVALNKRGSAAVSFLLVVPLFARWAFLNAEFDPYVSHLDAWFAWICIVLGLYWLFVRWAEWPPLFSRFLSPRRLVIYCLVALLWIVVLDLGATFVLVVRPYSLTLDCGRSAVFSRSTFGHDAVFTTHLIRVGHQARISNSWAGTWALAKIDKIFWSWPLPRIVLLIAPEGGLIGPDYLVDGSRLIGGVTRFLPIVEIRGCNRTQPLPDAGLELRLLRSGFPGSDVRIMGRVDRWVGKISLEPFVPTKYALVQGARVEITGPQGIITATTDGEGIYDIAGLPPGKYQVRLPTNSGQESPVALTNFPSNLEAGQVAEYSFSFRRAALRSK
jgi:hypothetical protein